VTQTIKSARLLASSLGLDAIDAELLIAFVLKKDRTFLFTWPEHCLEESQCQQLDALFTQRLSGEPIAYLLGQREFWSLPIRTRPSTLIPRPDTEVLVETVLSHFDETPRSCVDLGTGTGAIALALKSERPQWHILGLDRVEDAVELARENASSLKLDVAFRVNSWLADTPDHSVDVVVSNPPYIDAADPHLLEGDVRFEPQSALVAESFGYADIREIATQSKSVLRNGGGLFLEHGWQQAPEVRKILTGLGYKRVESVCDYGGNDRVTYGFMATHD
jgi:release factor glutamine methyltransferase